MKFFYLIFFLIFLSCNTVKKEYVCGDRLCVDKKEYNEYFAKNLTIEISSTKQKKNQTIDLVQLNTDSSKLKKKNIKKTKKEELLRKKIQKKEFKAERKILIKERKIKAKQEKIKLKKERKVAKSLPESKNKKKVFIDDINNNRDQAKKNVDKKLTKKIDKEKQVSDKEFQINIENTNNIKSMCDEVKDCDIDKITEILINKGKNKPFPNIASN